MSLSAAVVFWSSTFLILYAYVLFPAVAWLLAAARGATSTTALVQPTECVTVIIPAHNEERHIEARIRNILASDYPKSLLDVVVVSDASTDRTDAIVRTFAKAGVRLVVQETRRGKTAGLNRAMSLARGSLVVFTDANAAYPADAIGRLAAYFLRPTVGMVTGSTRYRVTDAGEVADATNLYTSLERMIKKAESAWGCCVGADGAMFAIRRALYRSLRDDDINDFVIPLSVIEQRYECVLADDTACSENAGPTLESEFRRQSRITNRTLRALFRHLRLLNPLEFPSFAFFLFSHKVVRFLVPLFMLLCVLSLSVLAPSGGIYGAAAAGVLIAGVLAVLSLAPGALGPVGRVSRFVGIFLTINLAVLHGWVRFLSGHGDVTWQHDRSIA